MTTDTNPKASIQNPKSDDWSRPMVHWELQAKDPDKMSAFYSAMFNWDISDGPLRQIGKGIGEGIKNFKRGMKAATDEDDEPQRLAEKTSGTPNP